MCAARSRTSRLGEGWALRPTSSFSCRTPPRLASNDNGAPAAARTWRSARAVVAVAALGGAALALAVLSF